MTELGENLHTDSPRPPGGSPIAAQAFRGGLWQSAAQIGPYIFTLIISIVAARSLGPDRMGRQSFIAFTVVVATQLAAGGLGNAIVRFIGELRGQGLERMLPSLASWGWKATGAFGIVAVRERELGTPVTLENLAGFGWERPILGWSMAIFMFGFLGFPLTGGFIGKFYVFAAAYEHDGFWWLIVVGVIATMISAVYYLGVVRAMYFRESAEMQLAPAGGAPPREAMLGFGVLLCLVVTIGSFFAVQPLIDVATSAANSLPL